MNSIILFFLQFLFACLVSFIPAPQNTMRIFKGMDLTFSPRSYPILLSFFTTSNERKFSFFFLLSIFSNESNARKSIVDRASQQGGNARTHPVDDEM